MLQELKNTIIFCRN